MGQLTKGNQSKAFKKKKKKKTSDLWSFCENFDHNNHNIV